MSYVSVLKNIPEILSQPTGIAAIASLGIHGAIALIVPLMPVNSSNSAKIDPSKAVPLMELSAADQKRLPQPPKISQLPLQQPQLPLQQQLPGASLGNLTTIYPPLQPESFNPPLSVIPSSPIPSSPTNYNISSLPSRQAILGLIRSNSQREIPRLEARYTPSASPDVNNLSERIPETEPLAINRLPELKQNNEIPGEPLNNPSPAQYDIGSRTSTEISPTQAVKSENNVIKIPQEQEKIALTDNSLSKSPEILTTESEFKSKGTEQLVAKLQSYRAFRQNIQQEYPNVKEKGVIRETIPSDTAEMESTVSGAAFIGSDGKVLDIKFQETSISPQLQSKVRAYFKDNPPQADKQLISSYPFQFKFQNNLNASGVSSKIQPSATPNPEKVSTTQTQPVLTPNPEKVSTTQTQPVLTPNPEKVSTTQTQPVLTPNPEKVSTTQTQPVLTPNPEKVSTTQTQPVLTPNPEKVSTTQTQPVLTPNPEKVSTPPDTKKTLETATVNTLNPVTLPTHKDNSLAGNTESHKKLIQKLRQIKEERKNPQ
ncbi:hypothetical protein H6F62_11505 [Anabaena sp. FACHB-1391]|uniref:hypothetical protein n=1 Tax=Anabaena sp. FACHB-1391 TaxID=2692771 RepID=UPI001680F92A|nr:hypothetical protein [Anabaena sp. FACHB-1391]MBD2269374.1 hypothetical protein [Anabaena sp. FACHB-1391]